MGTSWPGESRTHPISSSMGRHAGLLEPSLLLMHLPLIPSSQGGRGRMRAPCVVTGPPLRRCRCHGSGITSEPAAELSWHRNSFYSGNSGHSGADFVAPLHKHFRGPMYTGTRPCYSEALNLRRGGECGMARCGRPSRIVVNCFRALGYCCRTMM